MKKLWKPVCLALMVAVMVASIAGCGKPSIVGKWQSTEDANVQIEFVQNGNLIINTANNIITGTYTVLSNDYLKVTISGLAGLLAIFKKDTWKYTVTSSQLTLSADSTTKTFTRVK